MRWSSFVLRTRNFESCLNCVTLEKNLFQLYLCHCVFPFIAAEVVLSRKIAGKLTTLSLSAKVGFWLLFDVYKFVDICSFICFECAVIWLLTIFLGSKESCPGRNIFGQKFVRNFRPVLGTPSQQCTMYPVVTLTVLTIIIHRFPAYTGIYMCTRQTRPLLAGESYKS